MRAEIWKRRTQGLKPLFLYACQIAALKRCSTRAMQTVNLPPFGARRMGHPHFSVRRRVYPLKTSDFSFGEAGGDEGGFVGLGLGVSGEDAEPEGDGLDHQDGDE